MKKRIIKLLLILILFIILIVLYFTIQKIFILKEIYNQSQISSYSFRQEDMNHVFEVCKKENDGIMKLYTKKDDNILIHTFTFVRKNSVKYVFNETDKTYKIDNGVNNNELSFINPLNDNLFSQKGDFNIIDFSFNYRISNVNYNGNDCYSIIRTIKNDNGNSYKNEFIVDKEMGIVLYNKTSNIEYSNYKLNSIDDVQLPNLTEYNKTED